MPEAYFRVQWPDGEISRCYSPSTVVQEFFQAGMQLTVRDFSNRSVEALEQASRRVEKKYGYRCSSAAAELSRILDTAKRFEQDEIARILSVEVAR